MPLDTIWVRFQVSEAESSPSSGSTPSACRSSCCSPTAACIPAPGRIENTLNGVNTRTGTLEVQARFANPDHTLLPGQFGRVRIRLAERTNAILVPQKAVQELQGLQSVLTVAGKNDVQARTIVTSDRVGDRWIVEQGLAAGDTVIVEGLQKARPAAMVTPKPYVPSAPPRPPPRAGSGGKPWRDSSSIVPSSRW